MVFGFACYELPSLGHQDHAVGVFAVGLVIVGGVEKALLAPALLWSDGRGDRAAQGVQALGGAPDKLAVAVPVEGVDVLKVDVQAVVVLLPDEGRDIVQKPCLHPLVGEERVGKVGREAARFAEVCHRQKRGGLPRVGRLNEPFIRDGAQLPFCGGLMREGAEGGEIRHTLRQHSLLHIGIDVGVDLDLLAHVLPAAGDHEALPDHKARGVRDLVEAPELLRRRAEAPRQGIETVPRPHHIDLHRKSLLSKNKLLPVYSGRERCLHGFFPRTFTVPGWSSPRPLGKSR